MGKAFLEDTPDEVVFSSIVLAAIGAAQFVPGEIIQGLPAASFLSGFFGNMVDFILVYAAQLPFHSYTLGLTLLAAAIAPFIYNEKSWAFSFLTQTAVSVYGFLGLLVILEAPYLVSDNTILGVGAQVMVTGLAATQIFKNVLNSEDFNYEVNKTVYSVAIWQYLTAIVVVSAFQYIYQFKVVPLYAVLFTVLGLYGAAMIYAALEIAVNSTTGVVLSGSFLALLFLSSLVTFSLSGMLIALFIAGIFYWKKEKFEKRHSLSTVMDFEF